jgi:AcrR family transcriptional regulator
MQKCNGRMIRCYPENMSGVEGLRERKKQRTRETIAKVALELFAEQGFQATTIKQVADAADVAPRTVSGYFPTKEELAFPEVDEIFAELERRLTEREPGETAADALRAWITWLLDERLGADPEEMRCRREVIESDPALRTFERGLQERAEHAIAAAVAVDLGVGPDDLLPHMVAAATIAALDAMGRAAKQQPPPADLRATGLAVADQAMTFVGAGVAALAKNVRT